MKEILKKKQVKCSTFKNAFFLFFVFLYSHVLSSQVVLENEIKISDFGLHFNGTKVSASASNTGDNAPYDYFFGKNISAHGDCIKTYKEYVFMTWYRGGKADRHVMLTRYNTTTGTMATIEFPHRHTGYQNRYWIGESHNTIAVGVSPLNGTIHLLYDMHSYDNNRPSDGSLSDDYFRYSFSIADAASLPDADFTLDKFVKNSSGGYKHLSLNGGVDYANFSALTYPKFFLNTSGDLFMYMREGGNNNGAYKFSKYNATTATWSNFTPFNILNARSRGSAFNWGLYGDIKYVNGKMRIGFQRRSSNNNDKYQYQNGVYYAYSDDQNGFTDWKNHQGEGFNLPLIDADFIKVMEPGDYVQGTNANSLNIVGGFDWTVTEKGDVHIISTVKDNQFNVTKNLHTYKPAGATNFITSEDFSGAEEIYTSGDNIYIIGLTGGRVFVEKAEGGTNNFTRVYQATSGKVFDHGQIYIANGKLYYYLMQQGSGNALPLYLQIIDLDIVKDPFRVSLAAPSNGDTYNVGENVKITADAVDENSSISKVEFKINGVSIGEATAAPYTVDWVPNSSGSYTIKAIAFNANNQSVSSTEITINALDFDPNDITGKIYRLKNKETQKYLKSSGADIVESDYVEGDNALNWTFVKTNVGGSEFYNIDSEVNGVLRGAGSGAGNAIISTSKASPTTDTDKIWKAYYIVSENVYRFGVNESTNFLYHENGNQYLNKTANATDARSKWELELASNPPLSVGAINGNSSVKVFPNPANNRFTVALNDFSKAKIVISNLVGKTVFEHNATSSNTQIDVEGRLKPGVYLVRVITDNHQIHSSKLIIK